MKKLYNVLGEYVPGFFKISISKEIFEGITWGDFTEEEVATFIHEYVHFLQDVSTTRGCNYFNFVSKIIQFNFSHNHIGSIELPIETEEAYKEAYVQNELIKVYSGCSEHKKIHHIDNIRRERDELVFEFLNIELYNVNIYYDGKKYPYVFGGDCIAESMAYIIERDKFGAYERKNELPYNSCEMVCEKLLPSIMVNRDILVAICELSLMHNNSGDMFWHILERIKSENLSFKNVNEFEKYFLSKTEILFNDFIKGIEEAEDCINFLYPPQIELFTDSNTKVREFLQKGKQERIEKKLFIAKLMEHEYPINLVTSWMHNLGMPLVCDKEFNVYATDNLLPMLTPLALYNFFVNNNSNKCEMLPFCKQQDFECADDIICTNSPWKQVEKDELCSFGLYWYKYMQNNTLPVKRKSF